MTHAPKATFANWLGFELNVLRRIEFKSIAMPFTGEPTLGTYLKRREVRVLANDLLQSSWTKAVAAIQNNSERLSDDDVNNVLEDVYVPRHKLHNPALRSWFNETDSWWFDNVRQNLDRLQPPFGFAVGASLAMAVGDYVLSFNPDTLELRQPLSTVYRRLWTILPEPVNNGQNNNCQNKTANDFLAESFPDLMFLRLPGSGAGSDLPPARAPPHHGDGSPALAFSPDREGRMPACDPRPLRRALGAPVLLRKAGIPVLRRHQRRHPPWRSLPHGHAPVS